MKRNIISIFMSLLLVSFMIVDVSAKVGDVIGNYYSTDIKAILNGEEITSINIGGQTLISAEDMQFYGFDVCWDAQKRELKIDKNSKQVDEELPSVTVYQSDMIGKPVGVYYETDIVTYLDGKEITAFNIGGQTFIHAEQMSESGYEVIWFREDRILKITSPADEEYFYDIPLSYGQNKGYGVDGPGVDAKGVFSIRYTKDGIFGRDDADYFDLTLHCVGNKYKFTMAFYQYEALFNSEPLINKLKELCYDGYPLLDKKNGDFYDGYSFEKPLDKREMYEKVNQTVSISINGQKAEKVSVVFGAGNGHRDFYFEVEDLNPLKQEEINELIFSVGDATGEEYEIKTDRN